MPQMMPMTWIYIILSLTIIMLILTSFTYSFNKLMLTELNSMKSTPSNKWNWKW